MLVAHDEAEVRVHVQEEIERKGARATRVGGTLPVGLTWTARDIRVEIHAAVEVYDGVAEEIGLHAKVRHR